MRTGIQLGEKRGSLWGIERLRAGKDARYFVTQRTHDNGFEFFFMAGKSKFFEPLAALVASGESVVKAAESAGCANSTAYRLACLPEFKTRVSAIRSELVRQSIGKLSHASSRAVETMTALLGSEEDSVRLRAAVAILDRFSKLSEAVDLRERVEALEGKR